MSDQSQVYQFQMSKGNCQYKEGTVNHLLTMLYRTTGYNIRLGYWKYSLIPETKKSYTLIVDKLAPVVKQIETKEKKEQNEVVEEEKQIEATTPTRIPVEEPPSADSLFAERKISQTSSQEPNLLAKKVLLF